MEDDLIDLTLEESFDKNVIDFIKAVEHHPAIWDRSYSSNSTNKVLLEERADAWQFICRQYDDDFDDKSSRDQNKIETFLKRKWRNLRDCYMRELRDIARHERADHEYKKRKKEYIYFANMRFIGDLMPEERNKIISAEEESADFSYLEDPPVEYYSNEEEILQTFMTEGGSENLGEHIVIEQISSVPKQRKRSKLVTENSTTLKKRPRKKIRSNFQFPNSSTDLNNCSEDEPSNGKAGHFLDHEAYASPRPPRVAQELPNRRSSSHEADSDEDRLFMLSMVPHMKLVSKRIKLDMQADILNVVRSYVNRSQPAEK